MTIDSMERLREAMTSLGVSKLYVKPLAENDNRKQGIYVGGGFAALQHLPTESVETSPKGTALWAKMRLGWLQDDGSAPLAPQTKLILYDQYPEVRISGFLADCPAAPSESLREIPKDQRRFNNGNDGRMLFLGVTLDRGVVAYLAPAGSSLAVEVRGVLDAAAPRQLGVFFELQIEPVPRDTKGELLRRLREIHLRGEIPSSRMRRGVLIPYTAPNGAGYTLEAALGIDPNGRAEPDFMGWEVKSYGTSPVTVMTPEPDSGLYVDAGPAKFLAEYGHDSKGKRRFTGIHRHGARAGATSLVLHLDGFDAAKKRVTDFAGSIQLVDGSGRIAAGWSYAKLAEHWSRKHANAVYVPYMKTPPPPRYRYNSPVLLGEGTEFPKLLDAVIAHAVYYDPGVSMPLPAGPVHRRSQFRIKSRDLPSLYENFMSVEL